MLVKNSFLDDEKRLSCEQKIVKFKIDLDKLSAVTQILLKQLIEANSWSL